jgi:hypothetical protein
MVEQGTFTTGGDSGRAARCYGAGYLHGGWQRMAASRRTTGTFDGVCVSGSSII